MLKEQNLGNIILKKIIKKYTLVLKGIYLRSRTQYFTGYFTQ
jgi:hypothetical protein